MTDYPPPADPQHNYGQQPGYGQPGYKPPQTGQPWWRSWWAIGLLAVVIGIGIGAASAGSGKTKTKTVAGPTLLSTMTETATTTATVTTTPTVIKTIGTKTKTRTVTITTGVPIPGSKKYGSGTYVVGQQINPGTYQTTGADLCGWETDTDLAGQNQDGFDTASNGPLTAVVTSDDQLFKVIGDCTFKRLS